MSDTTGAGLLRRGSGRGVARMSFPVVEHRAGYREDGRSYTGDRYWRGNCICGWQAKRRDAYPGRAEQRAGDHVKDKTYARGTR